MEDVEGETLSYVGHLSQFEYAPGHNGPDGIKLLEVEPRIREPQRKGLISYESEGPEASTGETHGRELRLAESLMGGALGVATTPAPAEHDPEGGGRERAPEWEGERIIVYRGRDGRLFAIQMKCPHALAMLSGGEIEEYPDLEGCRGAGPFVACPSHTYVFDVSSGACVSNPDRCSPARTYHAEATPDGLVFVRTRPLSSRDPGIALEVGNTVQMRLVDRGLDRM